LQESGKWSPSQNYSGERKEEPVAGLAGKKTKNSVNLEDYDNNFEEIL
jgi:hypothetical protein